MLFVVLWIVALLIQTNAPSIAALAALRSSVWESSYRHSVARRLHAKFAPAAVS